MSSYSQQPVALRKGHWMLRTSTSIENEAQSFIRVKGSTNPVGDGKMIFD